MLRKQYQEKYIISAIDRNKKISEIGEETKEMFWLFDELKEEVIRQEKDLETIDDKIQKSKDNSKQSENTIVETENISNKLNKLYYALIGGGFGSLAFLYNPYIGAGALTGGVIIGGLLSYFD